MDIWGFLLMAIGVGIWLYNRRKNANGEKWGALITGVGLGIVIGAVGSVLIVMGALN